MSRYIDADILLDERKKRVYYHLKNGDIAIPIIDIEHAPTADVAEIKRSGADLFIDYPDYEGVKTITLRHKGYGCSFVEENTDRELHYGRWVDDYDDHIGYIARCSVCGKKVLHAVSYDLTGERFEMNYCPNCGASMMDEVEE